jgi:hypothetical protein
MQAAPAESTSPALVSAGAAAALLLLGALVTWLKLSAAGDAAGLGEWPAGPASTCDGDLAAADTDYEPSAYPRQQWQQQTGAMSDMQDEIWPSVLPSAGARVASTAAAAADG